ncbi:T9SS type A sorting domain-containing protein [Flavobacteriaceae bacterium]|nr:T9SS type A sorting domain-containing protein [Flavobacteriaceae bacterium]
MRKITLLAAILFASLSIAQSIKIVEIDADQTSTDDMEFIEIRTQSANQSLNGYTVVFYNGSDNESYRTVDLTGFSSDSNGYFILGSDLFPGADITMGPDNTIQNGADAIAIYNAPAANFPDDTPVTSSGLVDAVVYGTSDADDLELLAGLNQTIQWDENQNGLKDVESIQYDETANTFCVGTPTPRASNIDCSSACPISVFVVSVTCDMVTTGVDTYTTTLGFSGGGTAPYTFSSTQGSVSGDDPSSVSEGEIIITGVNEGTDFSYSLTSENCDISNTINSPSCEPGSTVNTIAELRAGTIGNDYTLNGEAIVTFVQSFRNQKFIEDPTAAILIDDSNGIITSALVAGDGITGLTGTLDEFGGMMQFRPTMNISPSSSGNTIAAQSVLASDLNANPNNYESEFVRIYEFALIDTTENPTWVVGTEYQMLTQSGSYTFRTTFYDADYIGADVPTSNTTVVAGIITERNDGDYFITSRSLSDFSNTLNANTNTLQGFVMTPNPATSFIQVKAASNSPISLQIFDVLGKQVMGLENATLVNIESLTTGLYIVKAVQNGETLTTKLIVE